VRAHELAGEVGVWRAAMELGLNNSHELVEVLEHWELPPVPRLEQRSTIADDPEATMAAFELVNQIGWRETGRQLHATPETLRAAFAKWGLGEPAGKPWQEARVPVRPFGGRGGVAAGGGGRRGRAAEQSCRPGPGGEAMAHHPAG